MSTQYVQLYSQIVKVTKRSVYVLVDPGHWDFAMFDNGDDIKKAFANLVLMKGCSLRTLVKNGHVTRLRA